MADFIHYSHAPITEALIDVRVSAKTPAKTDVFDALRKELGTRYPTVGQIKTASMHIELKDEGNTQTQESQTIGRAFRSLDQKYVFQARIDGMTLSRLAPYEDWQTLLGEFQSLWKSYCTFLEPTGIVRVGVRYINRLDLPIPFGDLKEYILTCPEVAPGVFQSLSGFLMQLHIPQRDLSAMLLINEGLVPPARENVASVVLDIELFREDPNSLPMDFRDILEKLRRRKNEVFEACITEKTRELIK